MGGGSDGRGGGYLGDVKGTSGGIVGGGDGSGGCGSGGGGGNGATVETLHMAVSKVRTSVKLRVKNEDALDSRVCTLSVLSAARTDDM